MNEQAVVAVTAMAVSVILQAVKDHLSVNPLTLRWVAAITGAIAAALAGHLDGATGGAALATNAGIGALVAAGTHSVALQGSVLGRVLKGIGATIFQPPVP